MNMPIRMGALVICVLIVIGGCAGPDGKNSNVRELVDNEQAFAATALSRGIRSAFLEYLSEDGVIFRPEPVNGREWYLLQEESDAYLGWEPVYADISRSGDFGYTTGPWEFSVNGEPDSVHVFGQYVSVWKRDGEGDWKVVIDSGTGNSRPQNRNMPLSTAKNREEDVWVGESGDSDTDLKRLERTEFEFSKLRRESGPGSAYGRYADADIRFLRVDAFPLIGVETVRRHFAGTDSGAGRAETSIVKGSDVASSGDMGYTFGTTTSPGGTSFFRIWKRSKDGAWNIVLDTSIPLGDENGEGEE